MFIGSYCNVRKMKHIKSSIPQTTTKTKLAHLNTSKIWVCCIELKENKIVIIVIIIITLSMEKTDEYESYTFLQVVLSILIHLRKFLHFQIIILGTLNNQYHNSAATTFVAHKFILQKCKKGSCLNSNTKPCLLQT